MSDGSLRVPGWDISLVWIRWGKPWKATSHPKTLPAHCSANSKLFPLDGVARHVVSHTSFRRSAGCLDHVWDSSFFRLVLLSAGLSPLTFILVLPMFNPQEIYWPPGNPLSRIESDLEKVSLLVNSSGFITKSCVRSWNTYIFPDAFLFYLVICKRIDSVWNVPPLNRPWTVVAVGRRWILT